MCALELFRLPRGFMCALKFLLAGWFRVCLGLSCSPGWVLREALHRTTDWPEGFAGMSCQQVLAREGLAGS